MNYREKIRKAIECPQFGNERYGEWGALRPEQRVLIKRLLNELDNADNCVKRLYEENKKLKSQLKGTTHCYDEEEYKQLKEQLEIGEEQYNDLVEEKENLQDQLSSITLQLDELKKQFKDTNLILIDYQDLEIRNEEYKTQQQEFIKYMKNIIKELECENVDDEEMRGYLFQRIDTFKEILTKYKEIIGVSDD